MKCPYRHQRAYSKVGTLWCPDCKRELNRDEEVNVYLRLLRKMNNIPDSLEQEKLEGGAPEHNHQPGVPG